MKKKLGCFVITGDKIHVSDPCYDYDFLGAINLTNVLAGKYLAYITRLNMGKWGTRTAKLSIRHVDYPEVIPKIAFDWEVEVDSGQAGFFDDQYYKENQGGEFGDTTTFFGLACFLTLSKKHGGIVQDKGVVSETGFGDGCYSLYVGKNKAGKIVSASIIFIADDELEEC